MTEKRFNPENSDKLVSEERKAQLNPEKVMNHLNVRNDETAADLGAGPGLFTIPLARRTEKVYAVDIEPEMLEKLRMNAEEENVNNIELVESNLDNIDLGDQSVNRVLNTFVIHEVDDVNRTIEEMKRILKPGGYLLLMDWQAVESESGPPLSIRIPAETMDKLLREHGLTTEVFHPGSEHYAIKAQKGER